MLWAFILANIFDLHKVGVMYNNVENGNWHSLQKRIAFIHPKNDYNFGENVEITGERLQVFKNNVQEYRSFNQIYVCSIIYQV